MIEKSIPLEKLVDKGLSLIFYIVVKTDAWITYSPDLGIKDITTFDISSQRDHISPMFEKLSKDGGMFELSGTEDPDYPFHLSLDLNPSLDISKYTEKDCYILYYQEGDDIWRLIGDNGVCSPYLSEGKVTIRYKQSDPVLTIGSPDTTRRMLALVK